MASLLTVESSIVQQISQSTTRIKNYEPNCVHILNVSGSFHLGITVDFERILSTYDFIVKSTFPMLVIHTQPPRTTAVVCHTGVVSVLGAPNLWALINACYWYTDLIREIYPEARMGHFNVTNYAGIVKFPFVLNTDAYVKAKGLFTLPDHFYGIIDKSDARCTHTIYPRHVMMRGATHQDMLLQSYQDKGYDQFALVEDSPEAVELYEKLRVMRKADVHTDYQEEEEEYSGVTQTPSQTFPEPSQDGLYE